MDKSLPSTSKTKSTKKIKKSKANDHAERASSKSKKKRKNKSEGNLSSETNSGLKLKTLKKQKQITEDDATDFTEIRQNDPPQTNRKEKENVTKSTKKLKKSQKKKQNDEGSQSSLVDFVSLTEQNGSRKKKRKMKDSKSTKLGVEKKNRKKKKRKVEESQSSITKTFTEIKQNDPEKKKRKVKESKSTVSNSDMKQKSCTEEKQIADESTSITSNSDIEENTSKKKKGKNTVGKTRITCSETEWSCLKKKRKRQERQSSIINFVIKLNAPKSKTGIETTSSLANSEVEQNNPQKNKQKSNTIKTSVTDSGDEQNNRKDMKGKDKKASHSRATISKSKQNVAKKRKGKSVVKPGSSKKRKKDLTPLQRGQEEREQREDSFLIQHPNLANHIKDELYCEGLEGSSFMAMSAMLKECILREKWEDANRIQCTMCMYQTPNVDCLWKFGAHVLQNHPSGNVELVEDLYRFVRKISMSNPYEKKLEHALYLLHQNRIKEALTTLTEMWGVSQRGKLSDQQEIWKKMTLAYAGLIEYCQWHEITKTREGDQEEREVNTSKEAAILRKRALVNLNKFNNDRGVWDIFITKQVEMLEAEGSIRKAEDLLTKYLSQNRGNPNAHVYLYQFLKRNRPTKIDKLKPVLKELSSLLPAEDYTLEYVDLMEKTGSADLGEVLPMLFSMADYSTCYSNSALWENLVEHVISIVESTEKTAKALLSKCWSCRKSWWTRYHFDKHGASELVKKNPEVALQKAILAAIFFGSSSPFVQKILTALQKKSPELSKDLENEITLWCNPGL